MRKSISVNIFYIVNILMNPNNIRAPQDRRKVYNEYIANLDAQIENLSKTEEAVKTLALTGQPPIRPPDTRTINEKMLDIEGQKRALRQALRDVTDGQNADIIMNTIEDEDVVFLAMAFQDFAKLLQSKFEGGVPAPIFNEYLQRYKADYINSVKTRQGDAQSKTAEELLLSIRELARIAPNNAQLRDLRFAVDQLPEGAVPESLRANVLRSVSELDILLPTSEQISALDGMDAERQNQAQQAFNDGLSDITTGAVVQALTQQLQQATPGQAKSVLEQILGQIVLTAHDRDALAVAQGVAQEKSAREIQDRLERASKIRDVATPKGFAKLPSQKKVASALEVEDLLAIGDLEGLMNIQTSVLRNYLRVKGIEAGLPIPQNVLRKMTRDQLVQSIQVANSIGFSEGANLTKGILPENLQAYKNQLGEQVTRQEAINSAVNEPVFNMTDYLTNDEFASKLTFDQKEDYLRMLFIDGTFDALDARETDIMDKALRARNESQVDSQYALLLESMNNANEKAKEELVRKSRAKVLRKNAPVVDIVEARVNPIELRRLELPMSAELKRGVSTTEERLQQRALEREIMAESDRAKESARRSKQIRKDTLQSVLSGRPKAVSKARQQEQSAREELALEDKPAPAPSRKSSKAKRGVQAMIAERGIPQLSAQIIAEQEAGVKAVPVKREPKKEAPSFKFAPEQGEKERQAQAQSEREPLASMDTVRKFSPEELKAYILDVFNRRDVDPKVGKVDQEKVERFVSSKRAVTDVQIRDMLAINEKMLKRNSTVGYGINSMKMVVMEKKAPPKGKRITFGAGGFARPTLTVSPETVEEFVAIPAEKSYAKLGRYLVHKHRLRDNQLVMRTAKGGQIMGLPSMTISPKLGKMISRIVGGRGFPSHDELTEMCDSDKDILYKIFKMSRAEGLEALPKSTLKNKQERDFNEFTIAKGQILSGNNSPELVKNFKTLLIRLMNDGQIVRKEGHDILMDLTAMGF